MALIDSLHQAGIGVILDWVPAHFPNDPHGLACFDGKPLYEHPDPRLGFHPEWNTCIFDFGRPEVRSFLLVERDVLARALSRRRPARRRRRLDALSRLRPQAGRVAPEQQGRQRVLRGGRAPAAAQRARSTAAARRDHARRGVDRVAARHRPDARAAASASRTSGTWAGCTTRSRTSRAIRSIASTTTASSRSAASTR